MFRERKIHQCGFGGISHGNIFAPQHFAQRLKVSFSQPNNSAVCQASSTLIQRKSLSTSLDGTPVDNFNTHEKPPAFFSRKASQPDAGVKLVLMDEDEDFVSQGSVSSRFYSVTCGIFRLTEAVFGFIWRRCRCSFNSVQNREISDDAWLTQQHRHHEIVP